MLKILTTAGNELEADLLLARLREADIHCMHSPGGPQSGLSGGRDILVEEEDLGRAREVLKAGEGGFDEEELARLSEEAGRKAAETEAGDVQTQAPAEKHPGRLKAVERLTGREHDTDSPDDPFGR